jgi:hypothetical protein
MHKTNCQSHEVYGKGTFGYLWRLYWHHIFELPESTRWDGYGIRVSLERKLSVAGQEHGTQYSESSNELGKDFLSHLKQKEKLTAIGRG